jgi:hypothetical protein
MKKQIAISLVSLLLITVLASCNVKQTEEQTTVVPATEPTTEEQVPAVEEQTAPVAQPETQEGTTQPTEETPVAPVAE